MGYRCSECGHQILQPTTEQREARSEDHDAPIQCLDCAKAGSRATDQADGSQTVPSEEVEDRIGDCQNGCGKLRLWEGKPRCWTCGWEPQGVAAVTRRTNTSKKASIAKEAAERLYLESTPEGREVLERRNVAEIVGGCVGAALGILMVARAAGSPGGGAAGVAMIVGAAAGGFVGGGAVLGSIVIALFAKQIDPEGVLDKLHKAAEEKD